MNWLLPGILYALFNSVVIFTNAKFQLNPTVLGMWRGMGGLLIAVPFLFFFPAPEGWVFWTFATLQGLLVGYFDFKLFGAAARFGAGGTAMMVVLAIVLSMLLWWGIDYPRLLQLLHDPWVFAAILLSLAGAVGGYMNLAQAKLDKTLLLYMAPAIVALSVMTINSKHISNQASLASTTLYYVVVIGGVGGLFNLVLYYALPQTQPRQSLAASLFSQPALKAGVLMACCSVALMISKNWAMRGIPNPAYLNALALSSPLWILLLNRLAHIPTKVSIKAALFTLACVAALVYLAQIPLPPMPY